jgi:GAF domain-containing protein
MFIIDKSRPIAETAKSIIGDEQNLVANCANLSSLIFHYYDDLNWAGFYFTIAEELVLGPFQGLPACIRIPFNKGVCGKSASTMKTVIVEDVHKFEGHIACDSASNSEIVVPIISKGKLVGVLDVDSPLMRRFTEKERVELESCVQILIDQLK